MEVSIPVPPVVKIKLHTISNSKAIFDSRTLSEK